MAPKRKRDWLICPICEEEDRKKISFRDDNFKKHWLTEHQKKQKDGEPDVGPCPGLKHLKKAFVSNNAQVSIQDAFRGSQQTPAPPPAAPTPAESGPGTSATPAAPAPAASHPHQSVGPGFRSRCCRSRCSTRWRRNRRPAKRSPRPTLRYRE